jgi:hypothetical protein
MGKLTNYEKKNGVKIIYSPIPNVSIGQNEPFKVVITAVDLQFYDKNPKQAVAEVLKRVSRYSNAANQKEE